MSYIDDIKNKTFVIDNNELKTNMKGLEELHHKRIEMAKVDISVEGKHDIAYMPFYKTKQYAIIENELKEKETQDNYIKMLEDRIDNLETTYLRYKKALEIIKSLPQEEKEILLNAIYTYTKSEEKYDLLKEAML